MDYTGDHHMEIRQSQGKQSQDYAKPKTFHVDGFAADLAAANDHTIFDGEHNLAIALRQSWK